MLRVLWLCGFVLLWMDAASAQVPVDAARHHTQAERLVVSFPDPPTMRELLALTLVQRPPDNATWETVPLPDLQVRAAVSTLDDLPATTLRWFRLRQPVAPAGAGPQAIYIPRIASGPLLVLLRDPRSADGWRVLAEPDPRPQSSYNRPVLVALPVLAGAEVEVVLGTSIGTVRAQHGISTVWIGPLSELRPVFERRTWLQLDAPVVTTAAILIVGVFAFGVWLRWPRERAYLYFTLSALVWCFRNLHYSIELSGSGTTMTWFWWATHASVAWGMVLVYAFALCFDDKPHRRLLQGLVAGVVISSMITLPLWPRLVDALMPQHAVNAVVSLFVTGYMTLRCLRGAGAEMRAITLAGWLGLAFGVHDLLLVGSRISPESYYLLPYAPLAVFASFLYATLRRYVQAVEQVAATNNQLEARLREREAELEANHDRLREVESRQTLMHERERLMADMHDGIGSTLLTSLFMLENGQIDRKGAAAALRECVDDLRLVVDSLEPIENDLGTLLGTLRYRLGRRLDAAGVELRWTIDDLPRLPWLLPPDALQLLRLLQEALSNVLKHAQAQQVHLSARLLNPDTVEICVQDNGCGFEPASAVHAGGRGMGNLRLRARKIQAQVAIESVPGQGTTVRLRLPVRRA